jgi:hypothetical protein
MSAQAYTNRRRVLAQAAVLKVQYSDNAGFTNTLSSSINCLQKYQPIVYTEICSCPWNGRGTIRVKPPTPPTPGVICIVTYDGGNSFTNANIIYSGETAFTNSGNILSGEPNTGGKIVVIYDGGNGLINATIVYSGEGAFTNSGNILSGQGTECPNNFITVLNYDGGNSSTNSSNILSDQV